MISKNAIVDYYTGVTDPNAAALLGGGKWHGPITYSFPDHRSDYSWFYSEASGFRPATADMQSSVKKFLEGTGPVGGAGLTLSSVEGVTNLSIAFSGYGSANIRVSQSTSIDSSHGYYPSTPYFRGDVWVKHGVGAVKPGSHGHKVLLHEAGHALGLKHGHGALAHEKDSLEFSVMTYRSYVGATGGYHFEAYGAPQTFMMYDIAALQALYGADFTTNSGDTVYRWNATTGEVFLNGRSQGAPGANRIFQTVWDGGGNDTYDLSNYGGGIMVDLTPGGFSRFSEAQLSSLGHGNFARGNVFNALQYRGDGRSLIENAIGGRGDDVIVGNVANNRLTGGGGHDYLTGQKGHDTLFGGDGRDTLYGGSGDDQMFGGSGADYLDGGAGGFDLACYDGASMGVVASLLSGGTRGDALGDRYVRIEGLSGTHHDDVLTGDHQSNWLFGRMGNDSLVGGAGNDVLDADIGNDTLEGGEGADTLYGGRGDDHLYGGAGADLIDGGEGGFDLARYDGATAGVTASLVSGGSRGDAAGDRYVGIEGLSGTHHNDVMIGNAQGNWLFGRMGNDYLSGGVGNDVLDADIGDDTLEGGLGNDDLWGGLGRDVFVFNEAPVSTNADRIHDFTAGEDTIWLSASVFSGLRLGALDAASFHSGGYAVSATQRVIYDPTSGKLFYDQDGWGAGQQLQLATLSPSLALNAASFFVA